MEDLITLNNGVKIPRVGFGTWKIRPSILAKRAVSEALETGYRLIDTARIYLNEKGVGQAIRGSGIPREQIFVTTKLWNGDQGYESALAAFDKSLKRLGLEYVDLYLIHWPVTGKRLDSWRALEEIYASGRAKAIGVSNFTERHLEELLSKSKIVPAVNQIEFHPFLYDEQRPTLEFCKKHDIQVEAYSPLAHGHGLDNLVLGEIANRHSKSTAQILLRWCIQKGAIPIPKSTDEKRMRENLNIFDFKLSEPEISKIDALSCNLRTCWDPNSIK